MPSPSPPRKRRHTDVEVNEEERALKLKRCNLGNDLEGLMSGYGGAEGCLRSFWPSGAVVHFDYNCMGILL